MDNPDLIGRLGNVGYKRCKRKLEELLVSMPVEEIEGLISLAERFNRRFWVVLDLRKEGLSVSDIEIILEAKELPVDGKFDPRLHRITEFYNIFCKNQEGMNGGLLAKKVYETYSSYPTNQALNMAIRVAKDTGVYDLDAILDEFRHCGSNRVVNLISAVASRYG